MFAEFDNDETSEAPEGAHFGGFEKVSVDGRDVRFIGEVSNSTMGQLIKCINQAVKHAGDSNMINVYISSYGGFIRPMFMAIEHMNTIRATGVKIHTHALGMCMSAGTMLFLAGDQRYMYSTTSFMVHDATGVLWGNTKEIAAQLEEWNILQDQLRLYIRTRTGLPLERIQMLFDQDTYIPAEMVKMLGYATEIVDSCGILAEKEALLAENKPKRTRNTTKKTPVKRTKTPVKRTTRKKK